VVAASFPAVVSSIDHHVQRRGVGERASSNVSDWDSR
jgi:hypothetical protein